MAETQRAETWGEIETVTMLAIMQELNVVELLDSKTSSHIVIFGQVSEHMIARGFQRTPDQIKTRWRNLKCLYGYGKRKLKTNGSGPSRKPKFFEQMDELLGNRPERVHVGRPRLSGHSDIGRSSRQTFDESLQEFALLNKETLTELFTRVNRDTHVFFAAEMEKQRSFDRELYESLKSHMKASMDAVQMLLSSQSPPTDDSDDRDLIQQAKKSKDEIRKRARNSGLAYTSSSGRQVEPKVFQNSDCGCRKKCFQKITEASRKQIFESFWKMGSFSAQNSFICGLVEQTVPKMRRPRDSSRPRKMSSNQYCLQVQGSSINVCKAYFLKTLQISDGRMTRAIKVASGEQPGSDHRGHHIPGNKISNERLNVVREHILSFPFYQSHYSRSENLNRKFLPSNLNVRLMYNMYKEHCLAINIPPVQEPIYRRTCNKEFNLHFHSPEDTCTKCDAF